MPLGWIDFSKTERSKVLTVLEMLTERGTLDELGIAPIMVTLKRFLYMSIEIYLM